MKSVFPVSLSCCRCQRYQKPGSPAFRWVLCQRIGAPQPAPDSWLVDAKVTSSLGLGDAPPLQNLVGRIREADLGLTLLGVGEPQVGKDVPGTRGHDLALFILGHNAPGDPCGPASNAPKLIPRLAALS